MDMEMKVLHRRDVIRGVRDRWNEQYPDDDYEFLDGPNAGAIRKALAALDLEVATPDDVNAAIGTTDWADLNCDFCDESHETLILLGEEPDYESRYVRICGQCLLSATATLAEALAQEPVNG